VVAASLLQLEGCNLDFAISDPCRNTDDDFIEAAATGDTDAVRDAIEDGADVEQSHGRVTALRCAVNGHHPETVRVLIDAGARPNNSAFLYDAVLAGDVEIVRMFVELGEKPTYEHLAATAGLESSLDPQFLTTRSPKRATPEEAATIADMLLTRGADPYGRADQPASLLWASYFGLEPVVAVYLAHGVDPNRGGSVGRGLIEFIQRQGAVAPGLLPETRAETVDNVPPLVAAAWQGNAPMVRLLLDAGADPNASADDALTPLYAAAVWGYDDVVQLLIDHGANPVPQVRAGVLTPAAVARAGNHPSTAALLDAVGS
jgi:ankyrin repeat protein